MSQTRTQRKTALLLLVGLLLSTAAFASAAGERYRPLGQGGITGSNEASMQLVTVPARVARVAEVPGSSEVWAIGLSSASAPGWNPNSSPGGQVVFLKYLPATGWKLIGPPRAANGAVINPVLTSLDLVATGEGWAAGENGLLLKKQSGSDAWVVDGSSGRVAEMLIDISLVRTGGQVSGFAVGAGAKVLMLRGGSWQEDNSATIVTPEGVPELVSVSAASAEEAWAVTGAGSRSLYVFRRQGGSWERVLSDQAIFDGPHPNATTRGFTISAASGSSVAVDPRGGAWVGGAILPSDPAHPFGDDASTGDSARPFVLRFDGNGTNTSYCPDVYWVRVDRAQADTTTLCQQPFPLSAFDVTDIQITGSPQAPDVFASGLGLYRLNPRSGGWYREPDSNGYLISVAFNSPDEGWAASTGNTFGAGGAVHSSTATLGHWTTSPERPRMEHWPVSQEGIFESVAVASDGRAVAVGSDGTTARYEPGSGWERILKTTTSNLHSTAWAGNVAWAVGERGSLLSFDGAKFNFSPQSQKVTQRSLFGVAFKDATQGYAVGAGGTILRYAGGTWRVDAGSASATKEHLYAIAVTRTGYIAVGARGTVIENVNGRWGAVPEVRSLVTRPGRGAADLWAVTVMPDQSIVAGGSLSSLVIRSAGGSFAAHPIPLEGTVLALAPATDRTGTARLLASVGVEPEKYKGDLVRAGRGAVLVTEDGTWRDIQLSRTRSVYISTDPSAPSEAVLSIATERGGRAWAASGYPENTPDEEGHLTVSSIGSISRIDLNGDPKPVGVKGDPGLTGPISFAFFADSGCGRGLCSATAGSKTMADAASMHIREEINRMSKLPGGPKFVVFGGNGRTEGIPEEIRQFGNYLKGFQVPVFGAMGDKDLFDGLESSSFGYPNLVSQVTAGFVGSNRYWLENLTDQVGPWGEGAAPKGFKAVSAPEAEGGLARTYYAFDYAPQGEALFRVIVLNSSTRSYGRADGTDQNPRYPQGTWLSEALLGANQQGLPTVVAMNQPTIVPATTQLDNWPTAPQDKSTFESTVVASRVSAILAGGLRINSIDWLPRRELPQVPVYIMGSGGGPMGGLGAGLFPDSKLPSDGFYPAWHLVTVDPTRKVDGQMPVNVRSFPLLDYVALEGVDGRRTQSGMPLRFNALTRSIAGGYSDPEQSKMTYNRLGWDAPEPCGGTGQGFGFCRNVNALIPDHSFYSEDPSIADFVLPREPLSLLQPARDARTNALLRDVGGRTGFLCTFKPGTTNIVVTSGLHRSRLPITVTGGTGPCIEGRTVDPIAPPAVPIEPEEPAIEEPEEPPFGGNSEFPQPIALVFAPPPAPVVAPAPPASLGIARKEEVEEAEESQGQAVRIEPTSRYDTSGDIRFIFAGLVLAAIAAAIGGTTLMRPGPATQRIYLNADDAYHGA